MSNTTLQTVRPIALADWLERVRGAALRIVLFTSSSALAWRGNSLGNSRGWHVVGLTGLNRCRQSAKAIASCMKRVGLRVSRQLIQLDRLTILPSQIGGVSASVSVIADTVREIVAFDTGKETLWVSWRLR